MSDANNGDFCVCLREDSSVAPITRKRTNSVRNICPNCNKELISKKPAPEPIYTTLSEDIIGIKEALNNSLANLDINIDNSIYDYPETTHTTELLDSEHYLVKLMHYHIIYSQFVSQLR